MKIRMRRELTLFVIIASLWSAAVASAQQDVIATDFLYSTTKVTIGGSSFDQVLRVIGLPGVSGGASAAIGVDANGNIRQDSGTSISTGGAWTWAGIGTFSAGVASPFKVSGGTSLSLAALGVDNARLGINTTPRLILENAGAAYQIQQDNIAGQWRLARLISDGSCPNPGCVPLAVGDNVTLQPKGGALLPGIPYGFNIGSPFYPIGTLWAGELIAETISAQETIATVGGSIIVAPTTSLIEAITSTQTTIKTKHNNLVNGSHVLLKRDFRFEAIDITSAPTPINKCSNNCDADSTTNWSQAGGGLTLDRNIRYQGDASILWTPTTGSTRSIWHTSTGDTAASTQYTMSFYLRRSDGAAIVPTATDYVLICGDGTVLQQMTATDATNGWYRLSATCTTGVSETDLFGVTGLPNTVNINIDAAQIETGSTLTPWLKFSSSYTVTRNVDGGGGNAWDAETPLVDTSNSFLDLYSIHGSKSASETGPTIVGNRRLSSTWNDWAPSWACGNLNGLYSYGSNTYGCAFGDAAGSNLTVDATNGIRFRNTTTDLLKITGTAIDLLNTGTIRSGSATALDTGTGIWLAAGSGTPTFRIGNPSDNRVRWDGTNLEVVSTHLSMNQNGVQLDPTSSDSQDQPYAYSWKNLANTGGTYIQAREFSSSRSLILENFTDSSHNALVQLRATGGAGNNMRIELADQTTGSYIRLSQVGALLDFQNAVFGPNSTSSGGIALGGSTRKWGDIWFSEPTTTSGSLYPLVTSSGRIMAKSNVAFSTASCPAGQHVSSWVIEGGLVISFSCS
jgi:hypothetical protein